MDTAHFGSTGHDSTRLIFGAAALWDCDQATADRTMERILEAGVNHIDTAASYGRSEERLGPWTGRHRDRFFLATKTEARTRAGAWDELRRSLDLLRTDHVDLWQLHLLVREEEWQATFAPGGALEAFLEAREQGLVRFLGVTGHGLAAPEMHSRSLERHDFDAVLLPFNHALVQDPVYRERFERLLGRCHAAGVAVQLIKTACRSPWGYRPHTRTTWYRPFEDEADLEVALGYALSREGAFVNSAGDVALLPSIIRAAQAYDPGRDYAAEMAALAARTGMEPLFTW